MKISSQFGLGTLHFGSLLNKQASREVIVEALDRGISFFDTAPLYGNGQAEEILGDVLAEARQETFICTKVGLRIAQRRDQRFGVEVERLTANTLKKSVETSLKRLKRESIDLLMLHAFDPRTPLIETLEALIQLHQEGKIRRFGCSNYNPAQLQLLLKNCPQVLPFFAAQCHYNLIEQRAGRSFIPFCEKKQIWVVVNRALARGALSGQYALGQEFRKDSRAAKSVRIQKWLTPQKLTLLGKLAAIARKNNTSLMQISLQWLLRNHSRIIVLLGTRNKGQLVECLQAVSTQTDTAVFEQIENVLRKEPNVYQSPPRYFEK